jgi:hypothetical protein
MRVIGSLLLAGALAQGAAAQAPAPSPARPPETPARQTAATPEAAIRPMAVGNMSELMIDIIYPTSDAIFYIGRGAPQTELQWNEFRTKMLMLAESANLLMMQGRARDQDKWMKDSKLLLDVGNAAYKAARAKDAAAIEALSDQLYNSCVQCHADYRPKYRTRPQQPATP